MMKITILTMIALFYLNNALARTSQYCQEPLTFTCKNSTDRAREENIRAIEDEVKKRAFEMLLNEGDDEVIKDLKDYSEIDAVSPARLRKRIQKRFYSKVRIVFSAYMNQNHVPSDLGMAQIKNALIKEVTTDANISAELKEKIFTIINQTRLISFQSDLDETTVGDANALFKECMKRSFIDNAFATEIRHEKVILVCPGEIIGTIEDLRSRNINTSYAPLAMAMTLGHEFSHHFDYRSFPEMYRSLLNEMKNHQGSLNKNVENYMSEITADTWGLRVYNDLIHNQTGFDLIDLLTPTSLNDLCGSLDDGEHPTGDFRIEVLAPQYLCH